MWSAGSERQTSPTPVLVTRWLDRITDAVRDGLPPKTRRVEEHPDQCRAPRDRGLHRLRPPRHRAVLRRRANLHRILWTWQADTMTTRSGNGVGRSMHDRGRSRTRLPTPRVRPVPRPRKVGVPSEKSLRSTDSPIAAARYVS